MKTDHPVFPGPNVERLFFLPVNLSPLLRESIGHRCLGLFLDSQMYSIGVLCLPLFGAMLITLAVLINFKIIVSPLTLFLFQYCFYSLGPFTV